MEVVAAVFMDDAYIVASKECLERFIDEVPVKREHALKRLNILGTSTLESPTYWTGLLSPGRSPSGIEGTYFEIYWGSMVPALSRPAVQCLRVDEEISCRVRPDNTSLGRTCGVIELHDPSPVKLLSYSKWIMEKVASRMKERCRAILYLVSGDREKLVEWCVKL